VLEVELLGVVADGFDWSVEDDGLFIVPVAPLWPVVPVVLALGV
jgi:hypothetical protein